MVQILFSLPALYLAAVPILPWSHLASDESDSYLGKGRQLQLVRRRELLFKASSLG